MIERQWFRVYSREWRRLCILAMSDVDARARANRRWSALGDEAREAAPMDVRAASEHQASERWAGITVRGT